MNLPEAIVQPIEGGVFVAVMGPSGSGKDTLLNYARERLEGEPVLFVRRTITRNPDGQTEDHEALAPEDFSAAIADGAFALTWEAHGLRYGLPSEIDVAIAQGKVVVANISRAIVPALEARYARVVLVLISVHPDVVAQRLVARGRESEAEIKRRLMRQQEDFPGRTDVVRIENSGPVSMAGDRLVTLLRDHAAPRVEA